jgi:hypothetical protein
VIAVNCGGAVAVGDADNVATSAGAGSIDAG